MDLAYEYGIKESTLSGQTHSYPLDPDPNPYIHWDMNKCILCRRCIRACSEMQCAQVLTKADRGFNQRISTAFGNILGQSGCELDGQCVALCPVDALSEKLPRGRGRNWELTKTRSVCPLCGCGCVFDLNTKERELIKITSNFSSPANQGALCRQGRFEYAYLNQPKRLKTPLLKQGGAWTEVPWEKALEFLAEKTKTLIRPTWAGIIGPDAFAGADQRGALSLAKICPHRLGDFSRSTTPVLPSGPRCRKP